MAALPPDTDFEFETKDTEPGGAYLENEGVTALPPGPGLPPGIQIIQQKPPTFTDFCWYLAHQFALFLVISAVLAFVGMECWNLLTDLTTLPSINWRESFAAVVLLRVVGLAHHH